ncbi:MAG: hypothetical protein RRY22_04195 [Bacilli bacterium]
MNKDIYYEITNGENTYKEIAKVLLNKENCIIGWTDEILTHYDILFTLGASKYGKLQRGIKGNDLFVSIMNVTSYGFNTDNIKLGFYIQEKLGLGGKIGEKIAELINGVIKELMEAE